MSQSGSFFTGSGPGGFVQTITGNSGGPVGPTGFNINVIGSGDITVTGNPGTSTLTISTSGAVADSFPTNSGTAVPVLGVLNILGGNNISTSGAGNTVTINVSGTTNHTVQLGNASGSLTSLTNGTTGQILTAVTGADPAWSTIATGVSSVTGTANQITAAPTTGAVVLTIPSTFIAPGSIEATTSVTATLGNVIITAGNLTLPNTNVTGALGEIIVGGTRYYNNFGTGGSNLFWGANSGNVNVLNTGAANVGYGGGTFQSITSGQSNSALGNNSLQNQTTGSQNTASGASSGTALNTGGNNSLFGYQSGLLLQSGNSNVAAGYQAGSTWGAAVSNNIAIGNIGSVADSGRIRIGTNGTHTTAFITGIDGVNVGSVAKVVTMASDQLGTATITAGTGISVTPGANTITLAATGAPGITWSVITADQTAAVNNGYICNKASALLLALPTTSAVGTIVSVTGMNTALGWKVTQAANQQIFFGSQSTTLGATGFLQSAAIRDSVEMVCVVANLTWNVLSSIGNVTIS